MTTIIVRDGRMGRDPASVTEAGGAILDQYETDGLGPDIGDQITLPTGEQVEVIGTKDHIGLGKYEVTVHVGDIWNV